MCDYDLGNHSVTGLVVDSALVADRRSSVCIYFNLFSGPLVFILHVILQRDRLSSEDRASCSMDSRLGVRGRQPAYPNVYGVDGNFSATL